MSRSPDDNPAKDGHVEYGIIMPFFIDTDGYTDRDREMFVCGVEWQMVYEQIKAGIYFTRPIHTENASRIRMMAGRLGVGRKISIMPSMVLGWCDFEYRP